MHPVSACRNGLRRAARGFTLIEIMVGLSILSILLALGIPTMGKWMSASRALAASEFYAEGLRMARGEALKRNVESRFSLIANSTNGQYDWQIDICLPDSSVKCTDTTGAWSTPTTPAAAAGAAGQGVSDFKSVVRSATTLPPTSALTITMLTAGADQVYFTPLGWIDTTIATPLNRMTFAPGRTRTGDFPTSAVAVTLAGVVSKCDPTIATTGIDSRSCP